MGRKTVTRLEDLKLVDKFLFDETMENREAYEAVVSILLENEVELLEKPQTEKELRISPTLWEVRLDVVGMGRDKKLYHTEMQKNNTGNLKKRSRYYQAQLDVSLLEPGSRDFMKYVTDSSSEAAERTKSGKIKLIHQQVEKIKESEKAGVKYMQRWEELAEARDEGHSAGITEGRSEGREQKLITQICKKIRKGKTAEQIAEDLEEEVEEIKIICEAAKEFAPEYDCVRIYEKLHKK